MRAHAWQSLGTAVTATTAAEAMVQGGTAGWDVRKVPLTAQHPAGYSFPVRGRYATVTAPDASHAAVLGVVGDRYRVIQNEEHAAFLDALAEETGATYAYAGTLEEGRWAFTALRLPGHLLIGGERVENYVAAVNSHDGAIAFTTMVTPVLADRGALLNVTVDGRRSQVFTARAGKGTAAQLHAEAREVTDRTFVYLEGLQRVGAALAAAPMTTAEFDRFIVQRYGTARGAHQRTVTRTEGKLVKMSALFAQHGQHTRWGALAAVAEWSDHFAPRRNGEREQKSIMDVAFKDGALTALLPATRR